ncbi:MAG: YajQ family cyclic di-GMP-binding protein [Deltaproteobacteria bacterium]|nr:YajQ family cyclic di-GMP-binding protein [Deltaproteobacteria bacterium]
MPSFDVVSEVNLQELDNALNQARKELQQRFDLKDTHSEIKDDQKEKLITITSDSDFTLKQVTSILENKLAKRNVPLENLDYQPVENAAGSSVRQKIRIKTGIEKEPAKEIVKAIKDSGLKVQAAIQDNQVRVTGKKKDDLQAVMQLLRERKFGLSLQFTNFRD